MPIASSLEIKGAGNAGCTPHPLPCVQNEKTHAGSTQVRRNHSGTPCAMVLRLLRDLPGVSGLLASVAYGIITRKLDPSVEGTGPHGLTVRACIDRLDPRASIASRLTSGDDRPNVPRVEGGVFS